jgi:hypothetical protein
MISPMNFNNRTNLYYPQSTKSIFNMEPITYSNKITDNTNNDNYRNILLPSPLNIKSIHNTSTKEMPVINLQNKILISDDIIQDNTVEYYNNSKDIYSPSLKAKRSFGKNNKSLSLNLDLVDDSESNKIFKNTINKINDDVEIPIINERKYNNNNNNNNNDILDNGLLSGHFTTRHYFNINNTSSNKDFLEKIKDSNIISPTVKASLNISPKSAFVFNKSVFK